MIKREKIAYWAGIIDGEGCIQLYKRIDSRGFLEYYLKVRVAMTNAEDLLGEISAAFGGSVRLRYPKSWKENGWKPQYDWQLVGAGAEKFLRQILPYLQIKRAQAENALAFRKETYPPVGEKWQRIPADILKKRDFFYQRGRKLMKM